MRYFQVAIQCEVLTGNVGVESDGVLVNPTTGASCDAYNSAGGKGVRVSAFNLGQVLCRGTIRMNSVISKQKSAIFIK